MTPLLGVVVVNYHSHRLLAAALAELELTEVPAMLVVVDNSTDPAELSSVTALAHAHGGHLIANSTNAGFGRAANQGAVQAIERGATSLLFLNPDAVVTTTTARQLLEASTRDTNALITPRIETPDGHDWFSGAVVDLRNGDTRRALPPQHQQVSWLTGACLAVSVALWERLSGFDERYFLYWEDVDLSMRAQELGAHLVIRHDLRAVHDVGGTQAGSGKSSLYLYSNARNRLVFAASHLDRRTVVRWLLATPAASWRIAQRGGGRRQALRPESMSAVVRGSASGAGFAIARLFSRSGK